jgi:hypothetical protein
VHDVRLPHIREGFDKPLSTGGFWVEVPGNDVASLRAELWENDRLLGTEELELYPVEPPRSNLKPQHLKIVFYCVQDWKMDFGNALEAIPLQFSMMGGTVWSDHEITRDQSAETTQRDRVRDTAATNYGVRDFWPNYPQLMEVAGAPTKPDNKALVIDRSGATNAQLFKPYYAAAKGRSWWEAWPRLITDTMAHPRRRGLSYQNTGFITDGLEFIVFSYDEDTIADFARKSGSHFGPSFANLVQGKPNHPWLSYNMALYTRVARHVVEAVRKGNPSAIVVNTAGSYGPNGAEKLSAREQASWSKDFNYTMPQWYSYGYSDYYIKDLEQGTKERAYGRKDGRADIIPLLNLSMGAGITDTAVLRFMAFDLLSASALVRGIGYYTGTYAFADADAMVGLSRTHTLIAQVEDYYVFGTPLSTGFEFAPSAAPENSYEAPDGACGTKRHQSRVNTTVRAHRLMQRSRKLLLTIMSHSDNGAGQQGTILLDLKQLGLDSTRDMIVNRLSGQTSELRASIVVDTRETGSMALLEVTSREN